MRHLYVAKRRCSSINILDGLRKWNTWKIMRWSPAYKRARRKVGELATDLVNEGLRYGLAGE